MIRLKKLVLPYYIILTSFTAFVLLFAFVIPHGGVVIEDVLLTNEQINDSLDDPNQIDTEEDPIEEDVPVLDPLPDILANAEILGYYENANTIITIYTFRLYDSDIYVADVFTKDATNILSALAKDTFGGRNVTETVSDMAEDKNAIFAINADYASHYDEGIVIRNGQILRSSISYRDAIALNYDGSVTTFSESDTSAVELQANGAWQVWSFGPILVSDSISVSSVNDGISRNAVENPRSAFGMVSENHYMFVSVDGRTDLSDGVDVEELSDIMLELNCSDAYNFDGGGSATMWFDGEVINNPSGGSERKVGDCVYILR